MKKSYPNGEKILDVANYFGVSTDFLYERTDNRYINNEDPLLLSAGNYDLTKSELEDVEEFIDFLMNKRK